MTGDSSLDVTAMQSSDQQEQRAAPADGDSSLDVTAALEELFYWAGGKPSVSMMKATAAAVGWFELKLKRDGARVWFVDQHGNKYSVARVKRVARRVLITKLARCQCCGEPIPLDAYQRHQRGARDDRRYCSNACRQKAYRKREA
jgi:hypothetical protein